MIDFIYNKNIFFFWLFFSLLIKIVKYVVFMLEVDVIWMIVLYKIFIVIRLMELNYIDVLWSFFFC